MARKRSRKCSRGRTKSGRCKKKPGPKRGSRSRSRSGSRRRSRSGSRRRSPSQKAWMKHVRKYAKEHGVTIKQAMGLACDSYYTKCKSRKRIYGPDIAPSDWNNDSFVAPSRASSQPYANSGAWSEWYPSRSSRSSRSSAPALGWDEPVLALGWDGARNNYPVVRYNNPGYLDELD